MKKSVLSVAVAAAMAVSATASAGQAEDMERALRSLEAQVSALKAEMAKMKEEQAEASAGVPEWVNTVSVGGAIEFVVSEGGAGSFDTLELELSMQATENTSGYLLLKNDGSSDQDVYIDEISITHDFGIAAVSATTGGHPFGDFSTSMVSDPLTKDIADTGGSAKLIAEVPVGEMVTVSASADDDISAIAATAEIGDLTVTAGHITDVLNAGAVSANHLAASYAMGDFSVYAEMVDSDGTADATNIEAAYAFSLAGRDAGVALGRQERKNSASAADDEKRNMFTATVNLDEGLDVSVEKMDSDNNTNDAWQAKIAYGF